jgi:hypothetical protein
MSPLKGETDAPMESDMTKSELIAELESVNDDAEITIRSVDGERIEFITRARSKTAASST